MVVLDISGCPSRFARTCLSMGMKEGYIYLEIPLTCLHKAAHVYHITREHRMMYVYMMVLSFDLLLLY